MQQSILLNTDSYKVGMHLMYPPNTTGIYSYIESRGGKYDTTLFFGLQAFIKEYLLTPITQEMIEEADFIWDAHGEPFNKANWEYILNKHNGYLPVRIKAVPEGSVVPTKNVLVTIENTDPNCFWLTTWLETAMLRAVWYPTTVATLSKSIKTVIAEYLERSGTPNTINFELQDFGARGVSSNESAGLGGMAHLVNFMGTDTINGMLYARKYYNAGVAGFSIPATEHSVISAWGKDNEVEAYRNLLTQCAKPGAIVACVSDAYDIYNAVENLWGEELRQQVVDSGATLVIRPDSGDPEQVIIRLLKTLGEKFGFTVNEKGYKVLNNVRLIQGDGVNEQQIRSILGHMLVLKWSADNIAFGMGGGLLQIVNRDDQKFAMKCSAACINNVWVDVYKDPITDPGKTSKKGRITLWTDGHGQYMSAVNKPTNWTDKGTTWVEALETVFENGKLVKEYSFEEVRNNSNI